MPSVTRLGDKCSGHDGCPPVPLVSCFSTNVTINGRPVGLVGDAYQEHSCPDHEKHQGVIVSGNPHVLINGRQVGRVGDPVSCGGVVMEGSPNVVIGDGGEIIAGFNNMKSRLTSETWQRSHPLSDVDKTILCLPDIAENMALMESNSADSQGWLYLADMFRKWLVGSANDKARENSDAFYVDWEWAESFQYFKYKILDLKNAAINEKAIAVLTDKIKEQKLFDGEHHSFNFAYETDSVKSALDGYHQYITVNFSVSAWGLYIPLGKFSIRAMAKGDIYPNGNGHLVIITDLYGFIFDEFAFEEQDWTSSQLGFWSCKDKKLLTNPLHIIGGDYIALEDADFRLFRDKHKKGNNFVVLSNMVHFTDFEPFLFEVANE